MTSNKILIFEDDRDLALLLERTFQKEGFSARCNFGGSGFMQHIDDFDPDLILLDLMLPEIDGYTICRCIKSSERESEIKVIMLTAKSEETDILTGYDAGADDYMTKPFSPKEVVARAKAVLRRKQPQSSGSNGKIVRRDELLIDDDRYEISLQGKPLELTHSEYRILRALATQPQRVYTREQLAESISSNEYGAQKIVGSRNIDVHIRALRKKLGNFSYYIRTLRGVGYSFDIDSGS